MKAAARRWAVNVNVGTLGSVWIVRGWPYFSRDIRDARSFRKSQALRLASVVGGSAHLIPLPMTADELRDAEQLAQYMAERRREIERDERRNRLN